MDCHSHPSKGEMQLVDSSQRRFFSFLRERLLFRLDVYAFDEGEGAVR